MLVDTENNTIAKRYTTIRRLAGVSSATISDSELDEIIIRSDEWVKGKTNKYDWTVDDLKWPLVIEASNFRAAAEVLDGVSSREAVENAEKKRADARSSIKTINTIADDQNSPSVFVGRGPNLTDQLNPANYTQPATQYGTGGF